jgi:hypothetical protein
MVRGTENEVKVKPRDKFHAKARPNSTATVAKKSLFSKNRRISEFS